MSTEAAMSLSRTVGSAAMHSSTRAWLVMNRQRWSVSSEVDFMSLDTIVSTPASDTKFSGIRCELRGSDSWPACARRPIAVRALTQLSGAGYVHLLAEAALVAQVRRRGSRVRVRTRAACGVRHPAAAAGAGRVGGGGVGV